MDEDKECDNKSKRIRQTPLYGKNTHLFVEHVIGRENERKRREGTKTRLLARNRRRNCDNRKSIGEEEAKKDEDNSSSIVDSCVV